MKQVFDLLRPQVVFHAAAHKHVPLMESNPTEAVKNNVLATQILGEVAAEHEVEAFVLISTDKAVKPTSIMGTSKRVAELVIQDLDQKFNGTRFLTVRFGNVLGSTGSVVPIFREQIRRGGPVTVTHPEATRYFMTIPEAAQLVMEAGAVGSGGDILMLDMGEPVAILALAQEMIALSGLKPFEDIQIQFSGLRPGEKLIEELRLPDEAVKPTVHPKIFVSEPKSQSTADLGGQLRELERAVISGAAVEICHLLSEILPKTELTSLIPSEDHDGEMSRIDAIH
jgi:FlaA1/EpsC-like NDP-sugar epimerase